MKKWFKRRLMIKIEKTHYNSIAGLLAECFLEDQLVLKQIKGIEDQRNFLEKLFLSQMSVLNKTCELYCPDDTFNSILAGCEKKYSSLFREVILNIACQMKLLNLIKRSELKIFAQNSKKAMKSVDLNWHKEFIKGNYYYIKIIAIAKEHRGKGIFKKLISPVIHKCNERSIPIILETNTPENIPIYQHYGFELFKTISESETGFCQYCFIKHPKLQL